MVPALRISSSFLPPWVCGLTLPGPATCAVFVLGRPDQHLPSQCFVVLANSAPPWPGPSGSTLCPGSSSPFSDPLRSFCPTCPACVPLSLTTCSTSSLSAPPSSPAFTFPVSSHLCCPGHTPAGCSLPLCLILTQQDSIQGVLHSHFCFIAFVFLRSSFSPLSATVCAFSSRSSKLQAGTVGPGHGYVAGILVHGCLGLHELVGHPRPCSFLYSPCPRDAFQNRVQITANKI